MKNITTNANIRPTVKWGSLIISILCLSAEISLVALNFYANSGAMADASLGLGILAAYGYLLPGIVFAFGAFEEFFEKFLPSYKAFKKWEKARAQERAQQRAKQKAECEAYENLKKHLGYK